MTAERRYRVDLTWDEIDDTQAALRARVAQYEEEARTAQPSLIAEIDQFTALWWEIIHRLGDARRAAHGQPLWDADEEMAS